MTIKTTNQYSLITIEKYGLYQSKFEKVTNELANERPTSDQQTTSERPQYNNIYNNINNNNNINTILNYTRLNLLFNYLINKNKKFENLKEADRESIVAILKRLDIYPVSEYMTEERIYDLKVQYWAVTELYLSPYKIYLNDYERDDFIFRFLKAKKYVDYTKSEQELNHFMGYFIKSLQTDLKK